MNDRAWRLRRSLILTPGHRGERLAKAATLAADSLAFDLEDGVPPDRKPEARRVVAEALRGLDFGRRERVVRVNAIGTPEFEEDLAALPLDRLDAIMVPKVEAAEQLHRLDARLDALPGGRGTGVIVMLETPRGVLNAMVIAEASRRCLALFFGPGDYTLQTGGAISPAGLAMPRAVIAAAAGAAGVQALDAPFMGLRDTAGTRDDALLARELGFSGKVVFHPDQIAVVNDVFTPDAAAVAHAERYVAAFEAASARGENVAYVNGEFVAMDLVPRMRRILATARAAAEAG
ncbi:CoA ester lyase [Roseomonas nepalensis]|uniref:CoA ester lyase n=1 Tax=Muricoccus nepalensis TaxID=1854500 RepID=A0A502G9T5_9PROT|nr:CoA ester lyase [Roseomonas nepalensis]TPG57786.1 CoA ester lyase [Roseomonas nepalensis]